MVTQRRMRWVAVALLVASWTSIGSSAAAQTNGCDVVNDPAQSRVYGTIDGFVASMAAGDTVTAEFTETRSAVALQINDSAGTTLFSEFGPAPVTFTYRFSEPAPEAVFGVVVGSPTSGSSTFIAFSCVAEPVDDTPTPDTTETTTETTSPPAPEATIATPTQQAPTTPAPDAQLPSTGGGNGILAALALTLVVAGGVILQMSGTHRRFRQRWRRRPVGE